jgi:hypothetical protein
VGNTEFVDWYGHRNPERSAREALAIRAMTDNRTVNVSLRFECYFSAVARTIDFQRITRFCFQLWSRALISSSASQRGLQRRLRPSSERMFLEGAVFFDGYYGAGSV